MSEFTTNDPRAGKASRHDIVLAWVTDAVACSYLAWLFWVAWRGGRTFKSMFEGMGARLPALTQFVTDHDAWLAPCAYAVCVAAIVGKEWWVRDKRASAILTCLLALIGQWLAQAIIIAYYLPLMDMVDKLS